MSHSRPHSRAPDAKSPEPERRAGSASRNHHIWHENKRVSLEERGREGDLR